LKLVSHAAGAGIAKCAMSAARWVFLNDIEGHFVVFFVVLCDVCDVEQIDTRIKLGLGNVGRVNIIINNYTIIMIKHG
jgi:hypothetical protein